jgi:signal transduction histidine kinase
MRLTKSPLARYALPVITVGSALGLTVVLKSLHWPHPFTFYFLAAIAVTFWFGGTGPGVFSLILASIVFNFVFTPPPGSDSSRLYYVINFVIVALLIAWVSASRRRAENLLDQARGELEIKVNERTASLRRANEELSGEVAERKKAEQALRASDQVTRGQAEALIHSLDVLASAPAPEKFLGQMLKTIGRLLKGQSVALWLLDDATDGLVLRGAVQGGIPAGAESNHPFVENGSGWRDDTRLQQMFRLGLPVVYDGVGESPREKALREYFLSKGTKTCLMVPTLVGGDVKGFISIRHGDRDAYRPEEIELAQALAHQVMLAIQLTEFAEQSRQAAVLGERNRMARDIHDTLAQGFTGVIVQLEAAEDAITHSDQEQGRKHLHRAAELARQSLNEARRSVRALRPQALREKTFWQALQTNIKNRTNGIPLSTEFHLCGEPRELPFKMQENLLHIGQEALTNTLKHAHATRFEASLSFNPGEVRLELSDNGQGFRTDDRHAGFGLAGMRERVEQMGGMLDIKSGQGEGTCVVVVSPYQNGLH